MKKYTIIIPIYNMEKFLAECIQSVCNQKGDYIEIILIDDGSTDLSYSICQLFAKKDKRIKVIHQKNQGVSAARNQGIEQSNGEWILFLDADDYINSGTIDWMNVLLEQYRNQTIFYFVHDAIIKNNIVDLYDCREDIIMATLKCPSKTSIFGTFPYLAGIWGKLYNRKILIDNNIRFDLDIISGEDMLFNITIQSCVNSIVLVNGTFYSYRINDNSATRGINPKIPERDYVFQVKLKRFAKEHSYYEVLEKACLRTSLGGIIISCNSYFFRYPLKEYRSYKKDLKEFVNRPIYKIALRRMNKNYLNINQWILLKCIKYHIYFVPFVAKKTQSYISSTWRIKKLRGR